MFSWDTDDLQAQQDADISLRQVISWLEEDCMPLTFPKHSSADVQILWNQRHSLMLQNGVLYRKWKDIPNGGSEKKLQLVLPRHLISEVLSELHNSPTGGHMGVARTLERVRPRFYWVRQRHSVEEWCRKCEPCSSRKSPPQHRCAPMQAIQNDGPFKRVAMDILGPLPTTARGNKYILVVGEYFTKWIEAYPMPDVEARTIARYFVNEFICRFGVPEQLHTDQGRNFESTLIREICKLLGIKKTRTIPYHPQSDGMIERFNRTLLNVLSIAVKEEEDDWDLSLPTLMLAYHSGVHETTGESPFNLMFGREAQLPIGIIYNLL